MTGDEPCCDLNGSASYTGDFQESVVSPSHALDDSVLSSLPADDGESFDGSASSGSHALEDDHQPIPPAIAGNDHRSAAPASGIHHDGQGGVTGAPEEAGSQSASQSNMTQDLQPIPGGEPIDHIFAGSHRHDGSALSESHAPEDCHQLVPAVIEDPSKGLTFPHAESGLQPVAQCDATETAGDMPPGHLTQVAPTAQDESALVANAESAESDATSAVAAFEFASSSPAPPLEFPQRPSEAAPVPELRLDGNAEASRRSGEVANDEFRRNSATSEARPMFSDGRRGSGSELRPPSLRKSRDPVGVPSSASRSLEVMLQSFSRGVCGRIKQLEERLNHIEEVENKNAGRHRNALRRSCSLEKGPVRPVWRPGGGATAYASGERRSGGGGAWLPTSSPRPRSAGRAPSPSAQLAIDSHRRRVDSASTFAAQGAQRLSNLRRQGGASAPIVKRRRSRIRRADRSSQSSSPNCATQRQRYAQSPHENHGVFHATERCAPRRPESPRCGSPWGKVMVNQHNALVGTSGSASRNCASNFVLAQPMSLPLSGTRPLPDVSNAQHQDHLARARQLCAAVRDLTAGA